MYEGFLEMQRVVTQIQYSSTKFQEDGAYQRMEYGTERNVHTTDMMEEIEELPNATSFETPKGFRWWRH
ncbi:MAG TPA: hypothetical protein VGI33_11310 [Paenibacillus sp.]